MLENIKNREILLKIKNNISEMNDFHLDIESEMSKGIFINDSIMKKDELYEIKKINNEIISQIRIMLDTNTNNE